MWPDEHASSDGVVAGGHHQAVVVVTEVLSYEPWMLLKIHNTKQEKITSQI